MNLRHIGLVAIGALCASGCNNVPVTTDEAPVEDTDTGDEPNVLPFDTSVFIPQDTAATAPPDLTPDNWVYMSQQGNWAISGTSVSGQLRIREYIDELDTASANPYLCEVEYTLTGTEVFGSTCASCSQVFDIEHYVTPGGDPNACADPDTPQDGAIWQMGYDGGSNSVLLNYFGTDVWLPWYDTTAGPPNVVFEWAATLAIEVPDTGDSN